jgi:hypothetical protein
VYVYVYEGLPIRPIIVRIGVGVGIGIGIDPCSGWHLALMDRSNFTAGLGQHHNKTVAQPDSLLPNPITHPFDTDADSDPDPEPASPLTSSDDLKFGPETYTYTAKRYTFPYTKMEMELDPEKLGARVRVQVRVRGSVARSPRRLKNADWTLLPLLPLRLCASARVLPIRRARPRLPSLTGSSSNPTDADGGLYAVE